jgi:phosphoribosyl 1,2-cyclic phosphodiesterase
MRWTRKPTTSCGWVTRRTCSSCGQVLAHRSGVRRTGFAVSFAGPKRFHAPPLTLEQLPPIEGLILSHDHYDHLDVPTIEYLARGWSATSCRSA